MASVTRPVASRASFRYLSRRSPRILAMLTTPIIGKKTISVTRGLIWKRTTIATPAKVAEPIRSRVQLITCSTWMTSSLKRVMASLGESSSGRAPGIARMPSRRFLLRSELIVKRWMVSTMAPPRMFTTLPRATATTAATSHQSRASSVRPSPSMSK